MTSLLLYHVYIVGGQLINCPKLFSLILTRHWDLAEIGYTKFDDISSGECIIYSQNVVNINNEYYRYSSNEQCKSQVLCMFFGVNSL